MKELKLKSFLGSGFPIRKLSTKDIEKVNRRLSMIRIN